MRKNFQYPNEHRGAPQTRGNVPTYQVTPDDLERERHYLQTAEPWHDAPDLPVSEVLPVPTELSQARGQLQSLLLQVKEKTGVYLARETDSSGNISIMIHAPSPNDARSARILLETHFKQLIKHLGDIDRLNKIQDHLFEAQGEVAAGQRIEFSIALDLVGLTIGKGGERINKIKDESGVKSISIDGKTGLVRIAGPSRASVQAAKEGMHLIKEKVALSKEIARELWFDTSYLRDLKEMSQCLVASIWQEDSSLTIIGNKQAVSSAMLILETQKDYISKKMELKESEMSIRKELRNYGDDSEKFRYDKKPSRGQATRSNERRGNKKSKDSLQSLYTQKDGRAPSSGGSNAVHNNSTNVAPGSNEVLNEKVSNEAKTNKKDKKTTKKKVIVEPDGTDHSDSRQANNTRRGVAKGSDLSEEVGKLSLSNTTDTAPTKESKRKQQRKGKEVSTSSAPAAENADAIAKALITEAPVANKKSKKNGTKSESLSDLPAPPQKEPSSKNGAAIKELSKEAQAPREVTAKKNSRDNRRTKTETNNNDTNASNDISAKSAASGNDASLKDSVKEESAPLPKRDAKRPKSGPKANINSHSDNSNSNENISEKVSQKDKDNFSGNISEKAKSKKQTKRGKGKKADSLHEVSAGTTVDTSDKNVVA